MKDIYLDYAATTPTAQKVIKAMKPYWHKNFANPSSLYNLGQKVKKDINNAQKDIAQILTCQPGEIIFTSGGTSSINLAFKGLLLGEKEKSHFIISAIEHPAVLATAKYLQKIGHEMSVIPVNKDGLIELETLKKEIKDNTKLLSIMMANNEIGTIQPLREIGKYLEKINKTRKNKIYFHSDACQGAGILELNVNKLHLDLLTLSGSKIYGPKGIGILYVKKKTPLTPLIHGSQDNNLYSGTENVPGIIGLAFALKLTQAQKEKEGKRLKKLRDYLIKEILNKIPETKLNGHPEKRLANNINISFLGVESESILLYLDEEGVRVSGGAACQAQEGELSPVILALGQSPKRASSAIRFSLGKYTTKKNIKYLMKKLPVIISFLRKTSFLENRELKLKENIYNKGIGIGI